MAAQVEIEDQASVTNLDNGEIFDSLSDDADSSSSFSKTDSLILLGEGNPEHDVIKTCLLSGMGVVSSDTTIVTIRKNSSEGITTRAKFLSFRIFTDAVARKHGGDANVKYGWYAGSKDEIQSIISYGFSNRDVGKFENDGCSHGIGIHLVPSKCSLLAASATEPDEEGLRYLLLCRLILGKPELIISGSKQSYPSSAEFDSGVDDLHNPRNYVIWSCNMNSFILPSYIVSFRSPRLRVSRDGFAARPSSPWVSFAALMSMLSKSMDPSRMNLIIRTYDDFRKRKIRRDQLVRKMREVAGDNLLAEIIKNHRDKNKVKN
ncbi:Poly(ADP-ribose) polymerase catalytic domain [Arabidopsis thaliana x Arabidopsis arenosa]|uniref:Poly(ADP-ribose) polymerase catalytic domain n=1 Tax=Arabidopsis thaliana x Arabidopsis arenosa TaxID=1240361 RepID=A0A8T2CBK8_9BRAS|nr:Poly(ADP-ribose) polymerase catalytic domain [Arabidopsis thaliana x Arabidopsis arenosa]